MYTAAIVVRRLSVSIYIYTALCRSRAVALVVAQSARVARVIGLLALSE